MLIKVNAQKIHEDNCINLKIEAPSVCPICKTSYNPYPLASSYIKSSCEYPYSHRVFVTFFCSACEKCFLATYLSNAKTVTILKNVTPISFQEISFEECIQKISPKFCIIYTQALKAESEGLTEIYGIGLRRALEFLVKDFLIHKHPEDATLIQELFLSNAIELIDNEQIKLLAQKAAWLGNDQTHYVAKHTDRDTEDLKKLIEAIKYFVSMSCVLDDAETIQKL